MLKAVTIVAEQPIFGPNPDETLLILANTVNMTVGKFVFFSQVAKFQFIGSDAPDHGKIEEYLKNEHQSRQDKTSILRNDHCIFLESDQTYLIVWIGDDKNRNLEQ